MQVGCGRSVRRAAAHARGLEGHQVRVRGSEDPANTGMAHSREETLEGHPRTRLLSPSKRRLRRGGVAGVLSLTAGWQIHGRAPPRRGCAEGPPPPPPRV